MSGIFGVVSETDCREELFYGTDYHSHMGPQIGGLAIFNGKRFDRVIHDITKGQFKSRFADDYQKLNGQSGIGVISDRDPQPLVIGSHFGNLAIVMAGLIENLEELAKILIKDRHSLVGMNDGSLNSVEIIAKLISKGENIPEGIQKVWRLIKGSATLLILTEEGIYAARDRLGYLPLIIGGKPGSFAVVSEACSFPNLGYKEVQYLAPGEIVLITPSGIQQKCSGNDQMQICAFLWIYTGNPASKYEGIAVAPCRERCGRYLAKRDNVEADMTAGVPDSGTGSAIGYAMESGLPFRQPLIKYTSGWDRSYTPPSQEIRDLIAKMKLIPIKEIIEGNRIILCEDSIVRGTQLRQKTLPKLFDNGAREVHLRPSCPPLMFPCRYALSTRSVEELAAREAIQAIEGKNSGDVTAYLDENSDKYQRMVKWIRDKLGATTLGYQKLDDMVEAIGLPQEKLCLYCWTGKELI